MIFCCKDLVCPKDNLTFLTLSKEEKEKGKNNLFAYTCGYQFFSLFFLIFWNYLKKKKKKTKFPNLVDEHMLKIQVK